MLLSDWRTYQVDLPVGVVGRASVRRMVVTKEDAQIDSLRNLFSASSTGYRAVQEGEYTELVVGGRLWMTDTPAEIRDCFDVFRQVRLCPGGMVLVHGLGLGVVLNGCLLNGAAKVTAVEKDPDVVQLVGPMWQERWGDRVEILEGDAFSWSIPKGRRWDVVWHDIWPMISADNVEGMVRLHRRFGRRAVWQGSWCRELCERARRREQKRRRAWAWH